MFPDPVAKFAKDVIGPKVKEMDEVISADVERNDGQVNLDSIIRSRRK